MENSRTIEQIIKENRGAYGYELSWTLAEIIQETESQVIIDNEKWYTNDEILMLCEKVDVDLAITLEWASLEAKYSLSEKLDRHYDNLQDQLSTTLKKRKDIVGDLILSVIEDTSMLHGDKLKTTKRELFVLDDEIDKLYRMIKEVEMNKTGIIQDVASALLESDTRLKKCNNLSEETILEHMRNNDDVNKEIEDFIKPFLGDILYLLADESMESFAKLTDFEKLAKRIELLLWEKLGSRDLITNTTRKIIEDTIDTYISEVITKFETEEYLVVAIEKKIAEMEQDSDSNSADLEELKEKLAQYK